MKNFKKALSLLLTLAMAAGLAACGTPASSGAASGETASGETATSGASTAAPAAENGDIVTLRWATVGTGMPANYDAWAEKVNAYLGEKIGVNIDMEVVSWGDWDNRRNVIVNTSGDFDILFTNQNTYTNDVKLGAFIDITEQVKTQTPDLYNLMPEDYWEAAKVNGKIYAVPTYKDSSQTQYIVWDKDLAAKLNIDTKNLTTLPAITDALKAIKADTGKTAFPQYQTGSPWVHFEYDGMSAGLPPLGVRYDDANAKVVPVFEQADILDTLTTMHGWYKDGLINSDAATLPEVAGYKSVQVAQGWSGAAITSWSKTMGVDAEAFQWKDTVVSNDTVRGSLNCISVNSKHPEKALEFLELVNTDSWVRDSFYYGLEGEDWEYTADKKVNRIKTDWEMAGYTQGTFFAVTQTADVDFNQWDEVRTLNENAKPSVLLGFTFDTTEVEDKLANCIEVYLRYRSEITTGTTDPAVSVPEMMTELRAAGFDEIVTAAQTQVDAFLASK